MQGNDQRRILHEQETQRPAEPHSRWHIVLGTARGALTMPGAMIVVALALCLALLGGALAERWELWNENQAIAQTRAQTVAIERDTLATQRAAAAARTPAAIEHAARRLGYIRPGETPVVIARLTP